MLARDPERRREGPPPEPEEEPGRGGRGVRGWITIVKRTFKDFVDDECPRMAAALAYYTIFSLPPLLVLILTITSVFVDPAAMEGQIRSSVGGLIGAEGAAQIQQILASADRPGSGGVWRTVLTVAALLFGATGAFNELQKALNRAWEVRPDPREGGVIRFVTKRLLSLGMAVTIAFLLLVLMVVSAVVNAFGEELVSVLPGRVSTSALRAFDLGVSLLLATGIFALVFKVLPDAWSRWRDLLVGAVVTAVLFVAGKYLLGMYLSRSDPGEAFGAAGSLALILVWVYYSAMIVFLGAEFTQTWALERGAGIEPKRGAVRLVEDAPRASRR